MNLQNPTSNLKIDIMDSVVIADGNGGRGWQPDTLDRHVAKRAAARSRTLAASKLSILWRHSHHQFVEASATAPTARSNASALTRDDFVHPLILHTCCSAALCTSFCVAGEELHGLRHCDRVEALGPRAMSSRHRCGLPR